MITAFAMFVIVSGDRLGASDEKPFDQVGQAMVEVIVDYLSDSTAADEHFSVAMISAGDGNLRHLPLPKADLGKLKQRLPRRWKHFVPLSEIRFPRDGERDPKDQDGKTFRGIESKVGDSISVFVISQIEYLDARGVKIHWDYGSGPLSGVGGSVKVSRKNHKWKLETLETYDR